MSATTRLFACGSAAAQELPQYLLLIEEVRRHLLHPAKTGVPIDAIGIFAQQHVRQFDIQRHSRRYLQRLRHHSAVIDYADLC